METMSEPKGRGAVVMRRHELAAFLRSRRERITPEDVGLPGGFRRRTAGLRREEVAQLAGVGVTWYTWLEQGRPIRASASVLEAVARTLRLDTVERQHLFRLAEMPDTAVPDHGGQLLRPEIQAILDGLSPMPAAVVRQPAGGGVPPDAGPGGPEGPAHAGDPGYRSAGGGTVRAGGGGRFSCPAGAC